MKIPSFQVSIQQSLAIRVLIRHGHRISVHFTDPDHELIKVHLATLVRLATACPFPDIRRACAQLVDAARAVLSEVCFPFYSLTIPFVNKIKIICIAVQNLEFSFSSDD